MTIELSDAGKRFNRDWIFRHLSYTFETGNSYAITGPNGSGKSTLLQVIAGAMHINEGAIQFTVASHQSPVASRQSAASRVPIGSSVDSDTYWESSDKMEVSSDVIYRHISICAPYLEVIEEMTLREFLDFHQGFKPFLPGVITDSIISILGLEKAAEKQIRYYSSGMKQRVKLAQAVFSDSAILLLDEPCTNLDIAGIELYHRLINDYCDERLVVVSSNDEVEYRFCNKRINVSDYK